jgi:ankyrin repeat protein
MDLKTKTKFISPNENTIESINLLEAISKDNLQHVKTMLTNTPELTNRILVRSNNGLLAKAINKTKINYAMLALLTKFKVDLDVPITTDNFTPLELACSNRDVELVTFLVKNRAIISDFAPHCLLNKCWRINYFTEDSMKKMHQIIQLIGGLKKIENMKNNDKTFADNAKKCELVNCHGGAMKVNMWELLNLIDQNRFNELNKKMTCIKQEFEKKESSDVKLGNSFRWFEQIRHINKEKRGTSADFSTCEAVPGRRNTIT